MKFEIKPPHIIFHDSTPGEGVTLHVNGNSLLLNGDASSFSDAEKSYAWAFDGTAKEGDIVVFDAVDRTAWGIVKGGEVELRTGEPQRFTIAEPSKMDVVSSAPPPDDITPAESGFFSKVFKKSTKPAEKTPDKSKKSKK
jgi:hypothetical protein